MGDWIKLYEQVPPLNEEVNLKFIYNGEERITVDALIPMMNGTYIWSYGDYSECEVIAWSKRKMKCHMANCVNNNEWACMYRDYCDDCLRGCKNYYKCQSCDYYMDESIEKEFEQVGEVKYDEFALWLCGDDASEMIMIPEPPGLDPRLVELMEEALQDTLPKIINHEFFKQEDSK